MDTRAILRTLPDGICTRQRILQAARIVEPSFKETQLRHLLGALRNSNLIVKVGRNQYGKADESQRKPIYTGVYSNTAWVVIECMETQFPLLEYRVWELSWLNEFFNHQVARNKIFLDAEYGGCDFVFNVLFEKFPGKVLLRPKAQDMLLYGSDDGIIIDRLISEAPKSEGKRYQVPLEKLIVDLFANKKLGLSKGDYPSAIEMMFSKYRIDQVALFRYARRRNKEKEVLDFLRGRTSIKLLVEG